MGSPGACGHIPVDGADIIAELVLPHLIELHAASFEDRVVLSSQDIVDQAVGANLDSTDFLNQFFG
jgi:hypothetical protein